MQTTPTTPVIIGVGQSVDRIDSPDYHRWSAPDLAAEAARAALANVGVAGDLAGRIDVIATTRTFEDSYDGPAAFGKSTNFPRSIAKRLGIAPRKAVWARGGGNSSQDLINEFCERIAAGEFEMALVCGAEAISTVRHAMRQGETLDFNEDPGGEVEDRGSGYADFYDDLADRHGIANASIGYALAENARRARLGMTREDYALDMGRLFAPFAAVAHDNPMAAWSVPAYSAEEIATVTPSNRWVSDPFPLHVVARDQVNLGAAVLIASRRVAEELGVAAERMVYLHGYARAAEKPLLARPDLGVSPAARAVARAALDRAGLTADDVAAFDFYSCFPIAVSNVAIDEFGLLASDPRRLTVTGGLPFFGGPGNNYSMHAVAEMVGRVRASPDRPGFVGANGGYLSKYSAGVYSTNPRPWRTWSSEDLQGALDAVPESPTIGGFVGEGVIETYTVFHLRGEIRYALVLGRGPNGNRFIARTAENDTTTAAIAHAEDVLGRRVTVQQNELGVGIFIFAT